MENQHKILPITEELTEAEKRNGIFINPLSDFGFKKLFGQDDSKEFLISFLNSLLKRYDAPEISDLTYQNTEMLGTDILDRKVVFDLYCTTTEGTNFVVELQKAEQSYFKNRSLCYGCRAITEQMQKGKEYKYELNKVFVVSILNFVMPENKDKPIDEYVHSASLRDDKNPQEVMFNELRFIFLELPKFNKEVTKESDIMDKWLGIFKDLARFNDLESSNSAYIDDFWTKFFHKAKIKNLETQDLKAYEESMTYLSEIQDVKDTAYKKLEAQMLETVEQLEKDKLKAEEKAKNLEKKLKQNEINGVKKLLKFNVPIDEIIKEYPNFKELEILALKN